MIQSLLKKTATIACFVFPIICFSASAEKETDSEIEFGSARLLDKTASWFAYDNVFQLEWADAPKISPDGTKVVYLRSGYNEMIDGTESDLWMIDSDGSNHRPLTTDGNAGSVAWSPDGSQLAYVAEGKHGSEIFLRWMDTGVTTSITRLSGSPRQLVWSPDGLQIAFSMFVPEKPKPFAKVPSAPKGAKWAADFEVTELARFRADGLGTRKAGFTHLFVMPATRATPRQLTSGSFNYGNGAVTWSKDSKQIYFSANLEPDWETNFAGSEIYCLDIATGEQTQITDRYGPDGQPQVSPDGLWLAYLGHDEVKDSYVPDALYRLRLDGKSEPELISEATECRIEKFAWHGSSNRHLIAAYTDEGDGVVVRIDAESKALEVLSREASGLSIGRPYTGGDFSSALHSPAVAMTHSSPIRPADVALWSGNATNATGKTLQAITQLNEDSLGQLTLGKMEEIQVISSQDDQEIEAWIVYPPEFDETQKYPLILEIHGGPHLDYGPHFAAEIQLMASAGYVVVYANPRGSIGYGKEFALAINKSYPGVDYHDLMSVVDGVIERGFINEEQLFVTGGSGGGILTAWIVGQTDRFAAAVAAKPDVNHLSGMLGADAYLYFMQYWAEGMPWEDEAVDALWQRSPLRYVGNVTTPTALLVGFEDTRTPTIEAEMFYSALKLKGVDTALIRVPDTGHSIARRPSNLCRKVAHILGWFERYQEPATEE